jgi:hypothetical protein
MPAISTTVHLLGYFAFHQLPSNENESLRVDRDGTLLIMLMNPWMLLAL